MKPSNSYKPADCCGDDCRFLDYDESYGQCWGKTEVVDEEYTETDWWWVHSCQGHMEMWDTYDKTKYIKEND